MGMAITRPAMGRTPAAAGVPGIERGAAGRVMVGQGKGDAPGHVKGKATREAPGP